MNYLVCGYLGYGNLGDELTALAISSSLFSRSDTKNVVFLAKKHAKYSNIKTACRFNVINVLKNLKACDVFVLGGGTLITDKCSKRSLFYYAWMLSLAKLMKKRLIVWSNGIDPLPRSFTRKILSRSLKSAKISLRDTGSLDALWEFCPTSNAYIHADPVFALTDGKYLPPLSKGRKYLTVFVQKGCPDDLWVVIKDICEKYGFLPFFAALSEKDLPICQKQGAHCGASVDLICDLEAAQKLLCSSAVSLSMRYHGIVLSLGYGCVPIGFLCQNKGMMLMKEASLAELCHPFSPDYSKIFENLENITSSASKYAFICEKAKKEMQRLAKRASAFLLDDKI